MRGGFDRRKSLQEIEQDDWGEPSYDSYLVGTCHRLRRKPLNEFTVEDLRIMIGQGISLPILIPLAVERLEEDPLAQGDYYPGDLLAAVLRTDEAFWSGHPDSLQRLRQVVRRARESTPRLDEMTRPTVEEVLEEAPRILSEDP
jgi:hypothetical protein